MLLSFSPASYPHPLRPRTPNLRSLRSGLLLLRGIGRFDLPPGSFLLVAHPASGISHCPPPTSLNLACSAAIATSPEAATYSPFSTVFTNESASPYSRDPLSLHRN